jgi:hypothetical protein
MKFLIAKADLLAEQTAEAAAPGKGLMALLESHINAMAVQFLDAALFDFKKGDVKEVRGKTLRVKKRPAFCGFFFCVLCDLSRP